MDERSMDGAAVIPDVVADADHPEGQDQDTGLDVAEAAVAIAAEAEEIIPIPTAAAAAAESLEAFSKRAAAACQTSKVGDVSCDIQPWADMPRFGRLSAWPKENPPERQSLACKCYQHSNCSVTKSQRLVSRAMMLEWLCMGRPVPMAAGSDTRKAAGQAHMAMLPAVLARFGVGVPLAKAAPSVGTGAASSSGA